MQHWVKHSKWPSLSDTSIAASIPSCTPSWGWSFVASCRTSIDLWAARWRCAQNSTLSTAGELPCGRSQQTLPTPLQSKKDRDFNKSRFKLTGRQTTHALPSHTFPFAVSIAVLEQTCKNWIKYLLWKDDRFKTTLFPAGGCFLICTQCSQFAFLCTHLWS